MSKLDIYFDLFKRLSDACDGRIFLKGNILLNKLLPETARATKDLDASVFELDLYPSKIVPVLESFAAEIIANGEADRFSIKPEILPHMSGGITMYDTNGSAVFAVDISLTENSIGQFVGYSFDSGDVLGSSIEKIFCDKCLSTLSRKRFRRIKDFYDLYILLKSQTRYDLALVKSLMVAKVGEEETNRLLDIPPFSAEIVKELNRAWVKFRISSFKNLDEDLRRPELSEVLELVSLLYYNLKTVR